MHFLLSNDDGIDAPGLRALRDAVLAMPGNRVTIVAPAREHSMCGHRVTTHGPLHVEDRGPDEYAVHGTPADCVRIGLFGLGLRPDMVLSGVNQGGNLGQDLVISGTVAAAREAAYHRVPAAAFSHYLIKDLAIDWQRIARWVSAMLPDLTSPSPIDDGYWNINFPHLPPEARDLPAIVTTTPARSPLNVEFARADPQDAPGLTEFLYTASYAARPRDPGSDVEACFGGKVSISRLAVT